MSQATELPTDAELPSARAAPILIVDDDPSKRLALKAVLEPLGYATIEAGSGAAGLRRVMDNDVSVILLDVRMPVMDGFETAALLRLREETELTPIIFVTAHSSDEFTTERFAAGAVDFLTAPVDPDELRAKVSALANLYLKAQANAARARDMQASSHHLRMLTDDAPIGIFQTDSDDCYTYTNARWSEITGISGEAALGAEWQVALDATPFVRSDVSFEDRQDGDFVSSHLVFPTPSGRPRLTVITSRRILDGDEPAGWVGTLSDITAEAEAEAALIEARDHADEASRLKSDFLANMSHEIRTPMTGIIGWTELLLETELNDEQRGFVQTLSRAGGTLMSVINAILDFSKIEKGQVEVERIEFDAQSVLNEVVEILSVAADAKGLSLSSVLDPLVPATVTGDPYRVRQVLTNLAGNAIKFTHEGQITLRAVVDAAGGAGVRFEVSDTGVGIPADKLEMIFEPFTQTDTSVAREYGGTGLGLAISHQLAGLMGGELGVTSEVGSGSTFWFTIGAPPDASAP